MECVLSVRRKLMFTVSVSLNESLNESLDESLLESNKL